MTTFLHDLRHGVRTLRATPGFALAAILVLGLGIGANTAIFSVVNAVLLRPLPFADPDRLVTVWEDYSPNSRTVISALEIEAYRQRARGLEALAALDQVSFTLTGEGEPAQIEGALASASLFPMLGVRPVLGRSFTADEDRSGGGRVVLLSHELWATRFGSDPAVVGRTLDLHLSVAYGPDRAREGGFQVVGVLPRGFRVPFMDERTAIWAPIALDSEILADDNHYLFALGRLRPGATAEQVAREARAIAPEFSAGGRGHNPGARVDVVPLTEVAIGDVRPALLVLLAGVGFVLLAACANVASLQLVRSSLRRREIAVRAAVGAARGRLVRQLATESLLVATAGGALGVLLAGWGVQALVAAAPPDLPRASEISVDTPVLAFALATTLATAVLFGLAPALHASRASLDALLREEGRGTAGEGPGGRLRRLIVVAEVTLAVLLLASAGLLAKSFRELQRVDQGFDSEKVLAMRISLPEPRYPTPESREAFFRELLERVEALPGVRSAATASILPLAGWNSGIQFEIDGRENPSDQPPEASWRAVSPGYFRTLGVPLRGGRLPEDSDLGEEPRAVVINEALAARYWSGRDPIGDRVRVNPDEGWWPIVGVVADLRDGGPEVEPWPTLYIPTLRPTDVSLAVRAEGDPALLAAAVRSAVLAVDPNQPVSDVTTLEERLARANAQRRFNTFLMGVFAALAVLLAAVGLYGVVASAVAERTREIGLRVALGARPGDVQRLVVRQGLSLVGAGVGLGLAAALVTTRVLSSLLYGVSPTDPATLGGVAALLAGVAFFAAWIPARRAARLDPLVALADR